MGVLLDIPRDPTRSEAPEISIGPDTYVIQETKQKPDMARDGCGHEPALMDQIDALGFGNQLTRIKSQKLSRGNNVGFAQHRQ